MHLNTGTIKVHGIVIDLVNLRKEEYTENSRVPVIQDGTPEEDSVRRDLTINAMFYNVNIGKVEDFTGKGLEDMKARVARMPQDPLQMFLDDPLRVMRVVRFTQRFGLE